MKVLLSVLDGLIVGVFATFTMDIFGGIARALGYVRILPLGRWILYLLKGKAHHEDILKADPVRGEALLSPLAHYGIGISLATFYLFLLTQLSFDSGNLLTALAYGLATSVLPFVLMFPSMGYGLVGLRYSPRGFLFRQSLVNHLVFGVGLWVGVSLLTIV